MKKGLMDHGRDDWLPTFPSGDVPDLCVDGARADPEGASLELDANGGLGLQTRWRTGGSEPRRGVWLESRTD